MYLIQYTYYNNFYFSVHRYFNILHSIAKRGKAKQIVSDQYTINLHDYIIVNYVT